MSAARRPPPPGPALFHGAPRSDGPLAERMRPSALEHVVGQRHLLAPDKALARAIAEDRVPSMILWGPPGCGKTTLARVVAERTRAVFEPFSAVGGGVPELRALLEAARDRRAFRGERTIVFVDEIHRFNKAQQDALLPSVERGDAVLIGATTENPSFSVNAALLSRARVFHLSALDDDALSELVRRALGDPHLGLGARGREADDDAVEALVSLADGDARRALSLLEAAVDHAASVDPEGKALSRAHVEASAGARTLRHDKRGDAHYDLASAFIKSMRGSDPDAALYWMTRLLEAGDDPLFVARRMIIFASEDIGNADPRALAVAVDADRAFQRLGMPEGLYPLAHACLFLASVPKSDRVKRAIAAARELVARHGSLEVPKKLRNAPTRLLRDLGHGEGYRSPHDHEDHVVPGEAYLPDELVGARVYEPSNQGLEQTIRERLLRLRAR
ncbi:MAG: replication-associated recombination protein A [Polyangiaceae bacterium]|nr:replication-associated recombination protein A [Polyangiaceae bacterium]